MKYHQPFGISDPTAGYINGNPSTGTMGSIPPAASIEQSQRELANYITSSSLVPTDADMFQVAKSVQCGRVMFGVDTGTTNITSISLAPVPDVLTDGMVIRVRFTHTNTGPTVLQVNAFGGKGIVHPDQSSMQPGEIQIGMYGELMYDAPHDTFQLIGAIAAGSSILLAPRDYYVNGNTGSDTLNNGLSAAAPFLTIQKALNQMQTINTNGWTVTIHIADYASYAAAACRVITGSGSLVLVGNVANPQNVVVTSTIVSTPALSIPASAGTFYFKGIKVQASLDCGVRVFPNSTLYMSDMEFGACGTGHYHSFGGSVGVFGLAEFQGGGFTAIPRLYISGNAPFHSCATTGALFDMHAPDLVFRAPYSIQRWAWADTSATNITYYNSMAGAPASGCSKYLASLNGCVVTQGRGAGALPGDVAGQLTTGGQFA